MVWIHGGAWVIGSGSERTYDAAHLVRRGDVVVVTINYRLGPFGFLRTRELGGGLDATGNEAMLDQVAALEWVRDEIAAFGGDPGNVTVFGESAGSVNIACLLTMPRARGLFHRAVLQSGSLNLTRPPSMALDTARQVLAELGIASEHAHRLRDVPAKDLMAAANAVAGRSVIPPFSPVADGELIPAHPFAAIADGSARGVPLIVGTNLEEMKLYRFLDPSLERLDEAALVQRCGLLFPGTGPDGRSHAERAVAAYRSARQARGEDTSAVETWLAISTDHVFRAGALKLAELHARHTPDVFVYQFAWKGTEPGRPQGAVHALDLPFVFGTLGDVGDRGDRRAHPGGSGPLRADAGRLARLRPERAAPRRRASGVAGLRPAPPGHHGTLRIRPSSSTRPRSRSAPCGTRSWADDAPGRVVRASRTGGDSPVEGR